MKSILVNTMAELAAAMHYHLNILDGSSSDIVVNFAVKLIVDDDYYAKGICGHIVTTCCGKRIILNFTITTTDNNDIIVTTTHNFDISPTKQNGAYSCVLPTYIASKPNEPTMWVAFDERKIFYEWEDPLYSVVNPQLRISSIDDLEANMMDEYGVLQTIAKDIIDTILAKVDRSPKK